MVFKAVRDRGEAADTIVTRYVEQDEVAWYKKSNLRSLYLLLFPACVAAAMASGFDASMIGGLQTVDYWDEYFGRPRNHVLGLISSMYALGSIFAFPVAPLVNDRFGHRVSVLVGSVIMIFGAALQAGSVNYPMFVIARWILGFGLPFSSIAAYSLVAELSHPKERATIIAFSCSMCFCGTILAAGVTFGTFNFRSNWSWRIPSLLQALPSFIQISFIYFIPESPRWLISKGWKEDAYDILVKYHAEGNCDSEFIKAEFAQIESTLKLEQENMKRSWKEMIATPGMRRRVLIASFLGVFTYWSGGGLIFYYLKRILEGVGVTDNRTVNQVNLSCTCWGLITSIICGYFAPRFKRRTVCLASTLFMLLVYIGWTISAALCSSQADKAASVAVLVMIFLYILAFNMGWGALNYAYVVEIFPFTVRSRGLAVFQWWEGVIGFCNQYVNPIGLANAGWKFYISYCVLAAFEVCFVYFIFPETSGRTLEELTFLFEPEDMKRRQEEAIEVALHGDVL
ncbi:hypothetical protein FRC07_002594 [Ceratobasidium sp. 392]|nr:hypothetical protein FRC07_002594 [Ceratobasidium sp. 392]